MMMKIVLRLPQTILDIFLDNRYIIKAIGVSYNGSTPVSKTVNAGSIPVTPAKIVQLRMTPL